MAADRGEGPGATARGRWVVGDLIWGPLAVGSLLGAVGLIGLVAGQPWLFPSLGPTAFLQAEGPDKPSARFYNTVVGHLVGLAAGIAAVSVLGAASAPSVMATQVLAPVRVGAAVLAAALTMVGLSLLRASHPPAAATMLLVALGGLEPTWRASGAVAIGAVILATLGEGVRYVRREIVTSPPR